MIPPLDAWKVEFCIIAGGQYRMHLNPSISDTSLSEDDIRTCVRVLQAIDADRSLLTRLSQEQRRELLTFAGLVAKPERHTLVKMAKAFRKADREATKAHDRKVIEQTGLRVQRKSSVRRPVHVERRTHLLRLQTIVHPSASVLRLHVRSVR
jgi:hypothetical protein